MRVAITLTFLGLLAAGACAVYGARLRYDDSLRGYPRHDPFRRDQEQEGMLWISSGAAVLLMSTAVWWVTHH